MAEQSGGNFDRVPQSAQSLAIVPEIQGSGGGGGGKGGGGGSKAPAEDPNSLRATSTASVLYLLGEGEIEGPISGDLLRDVYLDETPIKNADGTFNFKDVSVELRTGTQGQSFIPGFDAIESEVSVGVKVSNSIGAIVQTINDPNADAVVVTLSVQQFQQIDKDGNIKGATVWFAIDVATNGGAYVNRVSAAISGRANSSYDRSYRIPLPKPGMTWNIRVTRTTPDSTSAKLNDDLFWKSYKKVIEAKLTYPNSALLGLRISAEQFQSIPKLAIGLRWLKCWIPNNYNPYTRAYTGIWNGGFNYSWTNNPAWIFYDLLRSNRYGCGDWIGASQIRTDQLYAIGRYCDELVPDGKGGFEPRFTCNCFIQNREEAYKVLDTLASVFRGMVYWGSGSVCFTQDAPASAIRIYNESNTVQEVDDNGNVTGVHFSYTGASRKARHSVVLVSWTDKSDFYRTKVEYVEDRDAIARYGYREAQATAFGCTSQGQANRVGRWLLYTERYETELVTFRVGSEGLLARPGELIKIADRARAGVRTGGRILATIANNQVKLDTPFTFQSGQSYTLDLQKPDGTIESRLMSNAPSTTDIATTFSNFSFTPIAPCVFTISASNLQPQLFRVVSVSEEKENQYSISALEHNSSKFAAIEQGITLQERPISQLPDLTKRPLEPANLTATETLYESGAAGIRTKVMFGFQPSPSQGIDRYQVEYKLYDDPAEFKVLNYSNDSNYEWLNVPPGVYLFRVCAINKLGLKSNYALIQQEIYGLAQPPSDIVGAAITVLGDQALLRWNQSPDFDVRKGGNIKVRQTSKISGAISWQDGFDLNIFDGASDSAVVPLYQGTYMLKAIDSSGKESLNPAFVNTSGLVIASNQIVAVLTEEPTFSGAKYNAVAIDGYLKMSSDNWIDAASSPTEMIDFNDGSNIDLFPDDIDTTPGNIDDPGDGITLGINVDDEPFIYATTTYATYDFANTIDLGAVYPVRLTARVNSTIVDEQNFIDSGFENWDSNDTVDGDALSGVSATLKIALSNDGLAWGDWKIFSPGDYQTRFVKAQLEMRNPASRSLNIRTSQLLLSAELLFRDESNTLTTSTGGSTIVFGNAFYNPPLVQVSIENAASGDYYELTGLTRSGFNILVRNTAGTAVSRKVNWIASGVGRAIA